MFRLFKHYIPLSYVYLGLVEASLLIAALYLGVAARFGEVSDHIEDVGLLWPKALLFSFVIISLMTGFGLYKPDLRYGVGGMLLRLLLALGIGAVIMALVFYAFPAFFLGRGAFALTFAFACISLLVTRYVFFKIANLEQFKRCVLVLGAGKRASQLTRLRRRVDQRGFKILGYVHIPGEHNVVDAKHVIRLDVPLLEYAERAQVDEIVVAVEDRRKAYPAEDLLDCKLSGIDIVDVLTFFERQTGKVRLDILHPSWLIFSDGFAHGGFQVFGKRLLDVLVSLLLLALTWPIMLVTATAIWVESGGRGPIFYRQVRVGQNWGLFEIAKFRSMRTDAEKHGPQWAAKNDSRVTRVGAFIRKTRIDELPQLFNVLRGEMSFVGPRPERPMFVEKLAEKIPFYAERHRVKPGITGWAQVRYPYGASEEDALEKLQFDLYYVKNYSLFLDLVILFETAETILWGRGAR